MTYSQKVLKKASIIHRNSVTISQNMAETLRKQVILLKSISNYL